MGIETVSCVQFPVIMFCLMKFIQLAPLEGRRGHQNKSAFSFFPNFSNQEQQTITGE